MKLEYRTAQHFKLTEDAEKKGLKTFTALAAPYSEEFQEVAPKCFERFEKDAFYAGADPVKIKLEHEQTIGKITELRHTEQGLEIVGVISDTTLGRDTAQLLEDGVYTAVSVGFIPDSDSQKIEFHDDNIYITHFKACLLEVSVVSFPAYDSALITSIRNKNNIQEIKVKEEIIMNTGLAEIRQSMEELSRELVAVKENNTPNTSPLLEFRSAGDFMKDYASNRNNTRAFADDNTIINDISPKPYWFERELKLMAAKQPVTSMFTHAYDLPREGMSFDYPIIKTNTIQVAEQVKEGDKLVHGKITLDSGNVAVKTFGGFAPLSRQAIDRGSSAYLSVIHKAQTIQYATAIEAATKALLTKALNENTESSPIESALDSHALTVNEILDLTLDIIDHFDNEVLWNFTGLAVSADVFAYLSTLKEDSKAFQFTNAPTDKIGTLSITGRKGEIDGLNIVRLPASVGNKLMFGYSSEAINVHESPNAPLRLTDERDDTTLSNIFTVYGYAAHEVQASGIVPVKFKQG